MNRNEKPRDLQSHGFEAFRALQDSGLGIIDVGARGSLCPISSGEVAPLLHVVGFEPDATECERLTMDSTSSHFRSLAFLPVGLGRMDSQRVLYLCRSRGTSSLLTPNRPFLDRFPNASRYDVVGSQPVSVRSLDSLLADPNIQMPNQIDFIKMDTQGSELDILHGARKALGRQVVAIEIEVLFARLYESQAVFRDVDRFLDECGFTLFKLRRHEWVRRNYGSRPHLSAGQLVFGDALYFRDPLNPHFRWTPQNAHQAEALVLLAILYDLHDFAMELISSSPIAEMLNAARISQYVLRRSRALNVPWTRAQGLMDLLRVGKAALGRMRRFRRYEPSWGRGDGNFYSAV